MSVACTVAPSRAKASATARPIPCPAAVSTAVLPASLPAIFACPVVKSDVFLAPRHGRRQAGSASLLVKAWASALGKRSIVGDERGDVMKRYRTAVIGAGYFGSL